MKQRQVAYVLVALILLGVAGLILRIISSTANESVLSGLLPISRDVIDRVQITSRDTEVELTKIAGEWWADSHVAFTPKLDMFWSTVGYIPGAQLVARKPKHHSVFGISEGQGTTVTFYLGPSLQEQLKIGKWNQDVRLCYVKRSGDQEVYGVPCPSPNTFSALPDHWRDPIIVSIPSNEIEAIEFKHAGRIDMYTIRTDPANVWVVEESNLVRPANLQILQFLFSTLQLLPASGFVDEKTVDQLDFSTPDASIRVVTKKDSSTPTTRLRFIAKDSLSYYVKLPAQSTVFLADRRLIDPLLIAPQEIALDE